MLGVELFMATRLSSFFFFFQQVPIPYLEVGEASYYARVLEGNITASGEIYSSDSLTAAHKTLPLGTVIRVTNLENNREVTVKVNDRGPFVSHRILDLSRRAAKKLKMINAGVAKVRIEIKQLPSMDNPTTNSQ